MTETCGYRWVGPRVEVAHTAVVHVCNEPKRPAHITHVCACGANSLEHTADS